MMIYLCTINFVLLREKKILKIKQIIDSKPQICIRVCYNINLWFFLILWRMFGRFFHVIVAHLNEDFENWMHTRQDLHGFNGIVS